MESAIIRVLQNQQAGKRYVKASVTPEVWREFSALKHQLSLRTNERLTVSDVLLFLVKFYRIAQEEISSEP